MAEVVQGTQQEFWRPPSPTGAPAAVTLQAVPSLATTCGRCGTEFLSAPGFAIPAGATVPRLPRRPSRCWILSVTWNHLLQGAHLTAATWRTIEFPSWLRYLHFHEIKSWLGLSTASLIAFMIGLGCVTGALLVGLLTGRDAGGLASDPVLSRGMAVGGDCRFRGWNSAEESPLRATATSEILRRPIPRRGAADSSDKDDVQDRSPCLAAVHTKSRP